MNIIVLILSLLFPAPHIPKEPKCLLDCGFDARNA